MDYDEDRQIWLVDWSSIFSPSRNGGYVVIQKSDGKIVEAWKKG